MSTRKPRSRATGSPKSSKASPRTSPKSSSKTSDPPKPAWISSLGAPAEQAPGTPKAPAECAESLGSSAAAERPPVVPPPAAETFKVAPAERADPAPEAFKAEPPAERAGSRHPQETRSDTPPEESPAPNSFEFRDPDIPVPLERAWRVLVSGGQPLPRRGRETAASRRTPAAAKAIDLRPVGKFATVQLFWQYFNNLPGPSALQVDWNVFIFQDEVEPTWEHPENQKGGRWVSSSKALSDAAWGDLCMALIGEMLDTPRERAGKGGFSFEITGAILSRRPDYHRVSIWTRNRENSEDQLTIGKRMKEILGVPKLEYQDHNATYESGYRYVV